MSLGVVPSRLHALQACLGLGRRRLGFFKLGQQL